MSTCFGSLRSRRLIRNITNFTGLAFYRIRNVLIRRDFYSANPQNPKNNRKIDKKSSQSRQNPLKKYENHQKSMKIEGISSNGCYFQNLLEIWRQIHLTIALETQIRPRS